MGSAEDNHAQQHIPMALMSKSRQGELPTAFVSCILLHMDQKAILEAEIRLGHG